MKTGLNQKRQSLRQKFGNPKFVMEQISEFVKEGDFDSLTDLIAAYVTNSPKYQTQEEFAKKIGTTRQTLHRMFGHQNVSLTVFFKALSQIHQDAVQTKK